MAQGEVYRVLLKFTNADTDKVFTTAFYVDQPNITGFTVAQIGDSVKAWWNDGLGAGSPGRDYYDSESSLFEVTLRKWDPLTPVEESYTTGLPIAGAATSEVAPDQVSTLLSIRSGNIGRSYRNRMYLPAMAEGIYGDEGVIADSSALDIAEGFAGLQAELVGLSGGVAAARWVVYSKLLSAGVPATQFRVDARPRTQRRRNITPAAYQSVSV